MQVLNIGTAWLSSLASGQVGDRRTEPRLRAVDTPLRHTSSLTLPLLPVLLCPLLSLHSHNPYLYNLPWLPFCLPRKYLLVPCYYLGFLIAQLIKNLPARHSFPSLIPGLGRSPGEGRGYALQYSWASLMAQLVKNPPAMWETWVWPLGWEDPLEKGKATTPVFWPGEFHGLYSPWGLKESDMIGWLSLSLSFQGTTYTKFKRNFWWLNSCRATTDLSGISTLLCGS